MLSSSEHLLKLLQCVTKHLNQIKQVQALTITNGFLHFNRADASRTKWMSTLLFNALIRCYLNVNQPYKSILLFTHMLAHGAPPNSITFSSLIKAAVILSASSTSLVGRALHSHVVKCGVAFDPFIQTSFVSFYGRYGSLVDAQLVYEEISEHCIISNNAMLDVFAKNGDMHLAVSLFEHMPNRDVFSWTTVINGFRSSGCFKEAIRIFGMMIVHDDVMPNEATLVNVLSSCANIDAKGSMYYGKQLHGYIMKNEIPLTVFLGTSLIYFYGKHGSLASAMKVFNEMETRQVCTWNAIISSLASNGMEQLALYMFERMKEEKIWPTEVTFVAILTACSRGRFVELGLEFFRSMSLDFGIVPRMEHYGCVVDLLGRAGLLVEADNFIKRMPFEPDDTVLGALLGACKLHGAVELGDKVGKRLVGLYPRHCGKYLALWGINAAAEKWKTAANLRKDMAESGISKTLAFSLVDSP